MNYSTKISERMWNLPDKGELEPQREHCPIWQILCRNISLYSIRTAKTVGYKGVWKIEIT